MEYVGPPPVRPEPPRPRQTNHILHLLLSILTAGFWLVIWGIAAQQTAGINHQAQLRYREDLERWKLEYDAWQRWYALVYRLPPPPIAY
ncbi:MAG TPA: hypothetical protein VKZ81_10060 [Pseudonocardia sp.]|uniref:hypothetical protein n=1 Tax=Pseudonocardia sp. TaxID=60912 RepID=UPI002B4ACF78|nr:hypothetical protein [Pseudonocardia sp.]HLU55795.1 hypothetical protein [Pseudonocardia sp.]